MTVIETESSIKATQNESNRVHYETLPSIVGG